jgi:excisionase family DNA binding protein
MSTCGQKGKMQKGKAMGQSDLIKVSQVASALSVTTKTVRDWILQGRVDHVLLPGGHYRVRKAWLAKILSVGAAPQKGGAVCKKTRAGSGTRKRKSKFSNGSAKH